MDCSHLEETGIWGFLHSWHKKEQTLKIKKKKSKSWARRNVFPAMFGEEFKLGNKNYLTKKNYFTDPAWLLRWNTQVEYFMGKMSSHG